MEGVVKFRVSYPLRLRLLPLAALLCLLPRVALGGDFNPFFFPSIETPRKDEKRPLLGVFMESPPEELLSETIKKEGAVYIRLVIPGTAAERAGLEKGDIVIAFEGEGLDHGEEEGGTVAALIKAIKAKEVGDEILISIVRDGKEIELKAEIGEERKVPARVKPHPEIEAAQKEMEEAHLEGKGSGELYRKLEEKKSIRAFLNTLAELKERSLVIDSYAVDPEANLYRLGEVNYALRRPTDIVPLSRTITASLLSHTASHSTPPILPDLPDLLAGAAQELDAEVWGNPFDPLDITGLDGVIEEVVSLAGLASSYREEAFKALSPGERDLLAAELDGIYAGEGGEGEEGDDEEGDYGEFLRTALKVDYAKLFKSSVVFAGALSPELIRALAQVDPSGVELEGMETTDAAEGDVLGAVKTTAGTVIIGGPGATRYKKAAFLIIDFGGDDTYENNAGASTPLVPLSLVIDLAGNDRYVAPGPPGRLSQGAGFMGTGLLLDMSGDDVYISGDLAQGMGIFGVGALVDLGGDDTYTGDTFTGGVGRFGIGILLDAGGNDTYRARLSSQGHGSVRGLGALIDTGGNDFYFAGGKYPDFRDPENATKSFSQGFGTGMRPYKTAVGASGGIGLLIDAGGNDRYEGDYFSQGSSYWYSLGILHDLGGNDTYIAGRYSQGAGIHSSVGALIDEGGEDSYSVSFGVGQGMGHDFGVGALADFGGDDTYKGGVLSQGAATCGGLGLLYDGKEKNTLIAGEESGGYAKDDDSCGARGFGLVLDGKGKAVPPSLSGSRPDSRIDTQ
ncbi:MAG: PDZ domain-containing protein [Thermodesulfobacteriota bacterium]